MSKTKNHIPFLKITIEFIAIFVAVSLSFLAEDWREHLNDRKDEKKILKSLIHDLNSDKFYFGTVANPIDQRAANSGQWLQANWNRQELPKDSINWALDGLLRGIAYAPNRNEYEAVRNSGKVELIRNKELRRQINTHYEQTHSVMQDITKLNFNSHFKWVESIRPHIRFASKFRGPVNLKFEPNNKSIGNEWPNVFIQNSWNNMRDDINALNVLVETNTMRRLVAAWQKTYLEETENLILAINKELEDSK